MTLYTLRMGQEKTCTKNRDVLMGWNGVLGAFRFKRLLAREDEVFLMALGVATME